MIFRNCLSLKAVCFVFIIFSFNISSAHCIRSQIRDSHHRTINVDDGRLMETIMPPAGASECRNITWNLEIYNHATSLNDVRISLSSISLVIISPQIVNEIVRVNHTINTHIILEIYTDSIPGIIYDVSHSGCKKIGNIYYCRANVDIRYSLISEGRCGLTAAEVSTFLLFIIIIIVFVNIIIIFRKIRKIP
ncbi:MAG: hypothetical protein ACXAC7_02505 [Candidatus Hodarchaeales archaeon]|jgi:hypothetical protein